MISCMIKTFGCFNSLLISDLVNHKAIWSNYMRIDIELFEELFNHAHSINCMQFFYIILCSSASVSITRNDKYLWRQA